MYAQKEGGLSQMEVTVRVSMEHVPDVAAHLLLTSSICVIGAMANETGKVS